MAATSVTRVAIHGTFRFVTTLIFGKYGVFDRKDRGYPKTFLLVRREIILPPKVSSDFTEQWIHNGFGQVARLNHAWVDSSGCTTTNNNRLFSPPASGDKCSFGVHAIDRIDDKIVSLPDNLVDVGRSEKTVEHVNLAKRVDL